MAIDRVIVCTGLVFAIFIGSVKCEPWRQELSYSARIAPRADTLGPFETSWARPLAGGPIRALCIAPSYAMGDIIELADRIDLRVDLVLLPEGPDPFDQESLDELRKGLSQSHDIIIAGNFPFSALPSDIRDSMVERVHGGTGLLAAYLGAEGVLAEGFAIDSFGPADSTRITRGIGHEVAPEWEDLSFVRIAEAGDGRVVHLDYRGSTPRYHFLLMPPRDVARADAAYLDIYYSLIARAVLWAARREPLIWVNSIEDVGVDAPSPREIPPDLPAEFVQQMRDALLSPPTREFFVHLNKPADASYEMTLQLRDPLRLRRYNYSLPERVKKGDTAIRVQAPAGLGVYLLDVWLKKNGAVVDWFTKPLRIGGWPEIGGFHLSKKVIRPNDSVHLRFTLRATLSPGHPAAAYVRATDSFGRVVAERYQSVPRSGGEVAMRLDFVDLIGDQVRVEAFAIDTHSSGLTPLDLGRAAYDYAYIFVERPYPYDSFSYVASMPATAELGQRKYIASLVSLGVDAVVGPHDGLVRTIAARHNLALLGQDEGWAPASVFGWPPPEDARTVNWWEICRRFDNIALSPYAVALEKVRSYGGSSTFALVNINQREVEGAPDVARWLPWYAALHDLQGLWLRNPIGLGLSPALAPDATPSPWATRLAEGLVELRSGFAPLLRVSERMNSGIAVYDALSGQGTLDTKEEVAASQEVVTEVLQSLGYQYDFLSVDQVRSNFLMAYRLLVMPSLSSMSQEEIDAVRAFADQGGIVIADVAPGLEDESGTPRDRFPFETLFGARVETGQPVREPRTATIRFKVHKKDTKVRLDNVLPHSALRAVEGESWGSLGESPVCIVLNSETVGSALLNIPFHSLQNGEQNKMALRTILGGLLEKSGLPPLARYRVRRDALFEIETVAYRYGESTILALLRSANGGRAFEHAEVVFADEAHVYDMRTGALVGSRGRARLERGGVAFFSTLPYEVDRIAVRIPNHVQAGRRLVVEAHLYTKGAVPGNHPMSVQLRRSDGLLLSYYTTGLLCVAGAGRTYIPLALNEIPGHYTVIVRDVLTGLTQETAIIIGSPARPS